MTSGSSGSTTDDVTPTTAGPATDGSSGTGDPGTSGPVGTTGTGTTVATTEPVDTTAASTGPVDTTAGSSTGRDTTGTTAEPDTTTGDPDTGGDACRFDPGTIDIPWSLAVPPRVAGTDLTLTCTIVSSQTMDPDVSVTFSCDILGVPENVVLNYTLQPFTNLVWSEGSVVELVYHTEPAPWDREWLKITGGLIGVTTEFWAVRADDLAPPGITPEEFFGRNLGLFAACQAQPDPCGTRQGLDVHFEHYIGDVMTFVALQSGQYDVFGFPVATRVWLAHASELLEPIGCDDVAPRRIDMVVVDDASGF